MRKLWTFILLLLAIPALAQTSKNGRVQVGPFAVGPGAPLPCSPSDQWNTTDGHGAYICITTNIWQQIGGGGQNYQVVETAGVPVTTEPKLNFVNIPCVDNPGNSSTDCTASFQFVLNNAVVLPQEPRINCVPPLSCVDNAANTRTDLNCPSAIGVGGSHSSGCVPDPGAVGATTDYLGRDMLYHTSGSASTVKPDPSTAIMYVAENCNGGGACTDANDGLSWGTAKLTVYNAMCSLAGGNCSTQTIGNGTVFIGPFPTLNPTSGAGIWIMGNTDPNYGTPPAGWLKFGPGSQGISLIGVGQQYNGSPNGHDPRIPVLFGDFGLTHPAVWISGSANSINLSNMQFQYPARVFDIGECSNGDRTGTCGTQGVNFDNMGGSLNQTATNGPCMSMFSNTFWIWMKDFTCGGNAYVASGGITADNAAAVLIDASAGAGAGLIFIRDSNFAGGGIKVKNGNTDSTQLYVRDVIEEGDFSHAIPPVVWFTSWDSATGNAILEDVQQADAGGGSMPPIELDTGSIITGNQLGPTVIGGAEHTGAGLTLGAQGNTITSLVSPLRQGQWGFIGAGYAVEKTDAARRIAGLMPSRLLNQALISPSAWAQPLGGLTITSGATDPFGGTKAGTVTAAAGPQVLLQMSPFIPYAPVAGDWIVEGMWGIGLSTTGAAMQVQCYGYPGPTMSYAYTSFGYQYGDGNWQWNWWAQKVASGVSTNLCADLSFSSTTPRTIYGPVFYIIPAGTMSDNEVLDFANTMGSISNQCPVGSFCNVDGHPINADVYSEHVAVVPTGTAGLVQNYMDPTANWPSFKPNGNTAYIYPGFTGPWTPGQCATATATVNVFNLGVCGGGGGGGTVNPGLLNSLAVYAGAGTSTTIGPVSAPTTPANVPEYVTYTPNGTLSGSPSVQLAGIPVRTNSTNSDSIVATDRNTLVAETFAGSTAVAISSGLFNNGFAFKLSENSSNVNASITLTPSTGTCNGASTCTILAGQWASITPDASGSNLLADIHEPGLVAGSGILITRGQYSTTLSAPGAVGTTGSPLASELTCFSAPTTITNCNLSGDATTSNTAVVTVPKVNGTSYPAGGLLTTNTVPVVTGVAAVTYETVPNAALANSATTVNGATCTLGSTCNVNVGAPNHSLSVNEGAGAALAGVGLAANQIPVGVASADPAAGNLSELSATLYSAGGGGDTGTVMTGCSSPAAAALHQGQIVEFKAHVANSGGTPTLNWCSQGAVNITSFGTTLNVADITTSQNAILMYDTVTPSFQLLNPQTNKIATPPTWDAIGNAANNKTFANGGFTTTFGQTSNVAWTWSNTTAATNSTLQPSPTHVFSGQYCTVATTCGTAADTWTITPTLGSATNNINPPSTFTLTHAGSTGQAYIDFSTGRFTNSATNVVPMNIDAITGQTADIADFRVNGSRLAWVANDGGITSNVIITANRFTSNVATGTAPFTVSSTTNVANLNASSVGGITLGTPVAGGIGYGVTTTQIGTTSAGTSKQVVLSGGTGAPTMITFPDIKYSPAANCVNAVAGSAWSTGATPAALCRAGTNNKLGLLSPWGASDVGYIQFHIPADADLTTQLPALMLEVTTTESSTHTIIMQEAISCAKEDGSTTDDVAFNAARSFATVTETSRANQVFDTTITLNSTDLTGCAAPGIMNVKISRTTDTATNVGVYGLSLVVHRLLTVGAN